ncbi:putative HMP/thiamine import ATP-binding protein YkoD [Lentilactobacillus sunkii]|jgi:energy-coupling factor transporter ATP-binding protein EcfA2|uniref:Putative HMP/thiamine import ATP-binding protein YkoD n=1 Tax=Lentilactobacillus sunkii TaxID=481719 RepID=A0A1E7XAS9_9LACO|nr:ABC transporter ATP-binding protein [Lentilactobacillus sunkii]OFA10223.1 putative HMP/thiamine import ATP-binding protein YkoD [Lentilactobacillus sunkii]
MDELIKVDHLTFTYPDQKTPVIDDVNLVINRGQFVVIAGATGSGKTTLINHFKKELVPNGDRQGQVLINQKPISKLSKLESAKTVGYVAQDPTIQPIMSTVIDELAFALENVGEPSDEIERRIAELANYLGLDQLLHQSIESLSGGQLQLVNLASVLILRPEVILLDEPAAQLDPLSTQHFFEVLNRVHEELGITIVMTEHHLGSVLAFADRLILLQGRHVSFDGLPRVGIAKMAADSQLRYFVPQVSHLFLDTNKKLTKLPISVAEGQKRISDEKIKFVSAIKPTIPAVSEDHMLTAKNLTFSFDKQRNVIDRLDLTISSGDWLSIVGKNGSGKSTLLNILAGLRIPQHGKAKVANQVVWKIPTASRIQTISFLSQTPSLQFGEETVEKELMKQAHELRLDFPDKQAKMMIDRLHLSAVADQSPFDISGGQQQVLGVALALLAKPKLLILDEPTKGLDPYTKHFLGQILQEVNTSGMTILMASHDMEFSAAYSKHCAFMFDGHLNTVLPTREFFANNFFFTTSINRLLRVQVPMAIMPEDVNSVSEGTSKHVS